MSVSSHLSSKSSQYQQSKFESLYDLSVAYYIFGRNRLQVVQPLSLAEGWYWLKEGNISNYESSERVVWFIFQENEWLLGRHH